METPSFMQATSNVIKLISSLFLFLTNLPSSDIFSILIFFFVILVEVCAVLKLDNCYVGQSAWKALGTECWSQQFHIELEKVGELMAGSTNIRRPTSAEIQCP